LAERKYAAMPETRYYVRVRGRVIGPLNLDQLRALRDRGQFRRFHEVSEDRKQWVAASSLTELFPVEEPKAGPVEKVREPPAGTPVQDGSAPRDLPAGPPEEWHYLNPDGKPQGPVSRDELLSLWHTGAVSPAALVWKEGMVNWVAVSSPAAGLAVASSPSAGRTLRRWLVVAAVVLLAALLLGGFGYLVYKLTPPRARATDRGPDKDRGDIALV
jgi:hypothetical protein